MVLFLIMMDFVILIFFGQDLHILEIIVQDLKYPKIDIFGKYGQELNIVEKKKLIHGVQ